MYQRSQFDANKYNENNAHYYNTLTPLYRVKSLVCKDSLCFRNENLYN